MHCAVSLSMRKKRAKSNDKKTLCVFFVCRDIPVSQMICRQTLVVLDKASNYLADKYTREYNT